MTGSQNLQAQTAPSPPGASLPAPSGSGTQPARLSGLRKALLALVAVVVVATWPPTAMVVVVGMLPTIIAAIVDRTAGKWAAQCVGVANAAGVLPILIPLWSAGQTVAAAERLLWSPFNLTAMYGAAAMGWLVFIAVPPVAIAVFRGRSRHRLAALKRTQETLAAEWGPEVAAEDR